jgi:hypothetical protein
MMIHECKVQCHTVDRKTAELTGIEDEGKWLPFIFDMSMVQAAKLSSDEHDSPTYNCTTVFTVDGDTYIIDTPCTEFFKKFKDYNALQIFIKDDEDDDPFVDPSNDLEL